MKHQDDGRGINGVALSRDGSHLVYAYGSSENPSLSIAQPETQLWIVDTSSGSSTMLAIGRAPALAPDGLRVAFLRNGEVWIVSTDEARSPNDCSTTPAKTPISIGRRTATRWRLFPSAATMRLSASIVATTSRWNFWRRR